MKEGANQVVEDTCRVGRSGAILLFFHALSEEGLGWMLVVRLLCSWA